MSYIPDIQMHQTFCTEPESLELNSSTSTTGSLLKTLPPLPLFSATQKYKLKQHDVGVNYLVHTKKADV